MNDVGVRCWAFYGEVEAALERREWKWRGLGLNQSRGGSESGEDEPGAADERGRRSRRANAMYGVLRLVRLCL
jgi:hypothetical protein